MRAPSWLLVPLLASCAPDDIARSSCQNVVLATGDPWECVVTGERIGRVSAIHFDTPSRNQVAQVKIAMQVAKGTLRIGYRDLAGDQQLTVTPATPATIEMKTRLHRDDRSFTLSFEPIGGQVEGLAGTVSYSTP